MAVVWVREVWEGRGGSDDWDRKRDFTRSFQVLTDDTGDGPSVVAQAAGIPLLGSAHPDDAAALMVGIKASQDSSSPYLWSVTCEYTTQIEFPEAVPVDPGTGQTEPDTPGDAPETPEPAERQENPLDRAPVWKISFQETQEPLRRAYEYDADGELTGELIAVVNSAKLPFDPPVMIEASRIIVAVTFNVARVNMRKMADLKDSVNSVAWYGMPARTVRCVGAEASSKYENSLSFWEVTYTFALKDDTWDIRVLDSGYAELIPGSAPPRPVVDHWQKIKDPFGVEATEPVPLDGNGRKLTPGNPEVYKVFRGYKERDFNTLV